PGFTSSSFHSAALARIAFQDVDLSADTAAQTNRGSRRSAPENTYVLLPIVDTRPFASEPRAHARNRSTHEPDLGPREPDPSEERGHFVPDGFTHTVPRRGPCRGRVASRSRSTSRGHGVPASVRGSTDTVEGTAGSARFARGERDAAGR